MSQLTAKKSENISSATGRRPVIAAPIAAPTMACSLIGVSRTRSGPTRSITPSVSLNTPPAAPTSSPISTTDRSRSISWAIPAATACRYVSSAISRRLGSSPTPRRPPVGPQLGLDDVGRRFGCRASLLLGRPHRIVALRLDRGELFLLDAGGAQPGAIRGNRVAREPRANLVVGAVLRRIRT